MSLTWNYTLTADEQRASQTFFRVTWSKFNLGTSSFDDFASYLKIIGNNPTFSEPNAPRIVVDRSISTSSAILQFKDVRLEDEGIYKFEVSVTFPGAATIAEQLFNLTLKGRGCSLLLILSVLIITGSLRGVCAGLTPPPPTPSFREMNSGSLIREWYSTKKNFCGLLVLKYNMRRS